jgi:hypothetical protein
MTTTTETRPFDATGWLKWSEEEAAERIAPYYPAYLAIRARLDADGLYPYNDRFIGQIDGTQSKDEGTLVYLLQSWHTLQGERAQLAAFIERGAYKITPADVQSQPYGAMRGTVANVGRYSGGFRTGYEIRENVRVVTVYSGNSLGYIPPRKRNAFHLDGREIYFLPTQKEGTR